MGLGGPGRTLAGGETLTSSYITVAIPYVNAEPHLGYAYELVLADIGARARRAIAGNEVRFLGGTDDYSLKNVLAAEAAQLATRDFVAAHASEFAALAEPLSISFDDYIHTSSDPRHIPGVQRLWKAVAQRGDLYRRSYVGDYCVGCEQFYNADELVSGCCPEHGTPPERVEEENWFFRLSAYQRYLEEALSSREVRVSPESFRQEALSFVRSGLEDISVSRSAARARGWGVPVPGDPGQVIYVWFDALANYITALGFGELDNGRAIGEPYRRWWAGSDERVHVVGKGILRFHAVFWPAFLASAGEPSPTRVQVHPYLTIDGAKLSKSSGKAVSPTEIVDAFGADALRWWFARDVHASVDTDFTVDRLIARANEDLAGGFANVVSRLAALVHRYRGGVVPDGDPVAVIGVAGVQADVLRALVDFDLRAGTARLLDALSALNKDIEATSPWKLAKDENARSDFDALLVRQLRAATEIVAALRPVLPELASKLAVLVGVPGQRLGPLQPVFKRFVDK